MEAVLGMVWTRGATSRKIGWRCAAHFLKPLPYFRAKSVIFPTLFQTWSKMWYPISGPGRGGDSHMKQTGMLIVSLRGVNFGCWSRLGCSGQSANILRCRLGFREETQNYAKRNRSQIFFLTCFVYCITSVIINQRFLQIVENIIIWLISDNKGSVITRCLCALSIVCLQQETQRV